MNSTIVTVICPECNGCQAYCDTSIVYTSMPPQYKCTCNDCNYDWFITSDKLMGIRSLNRNDHVLVSRTELMLRINELEERIRKLENKDDRQ